MAAARHRPIMGESLSMGAGVQGWPFIAIPLDFHLKIQYNKAMSYDVKFRRRALEYWAEGHTKAETAAVFSVGTSTLQTRKSQLNQTGKLEAKVRETPWRKIDPEKLLAYVAERPDAYQHEIAAAFGVRLFAIQKALKRLGITRKKNHSAP
jgi:transposase